MSDPFLGEIRTFGMNFVPKGWLPCDGGLLPINQNQALYALLGTSFGGDGITTFALPDLRDRSSLGQSNSYATGAVGGEESHTLTTAELPAHSHTVLAAGAATTTDPTGATFATAESRVYASTPSTAMDAAAVSATGSGQPHENMAPYLALTKAIAATGIFPSRS